jgi:hypothetical protein
MDGCKLNLPTLTATKRCQLASPRQPCHHDQIVETDTRVLRLFTVNEYRTMRVAEVLSDFRTLQYYIAAAPVDPVDTADYYTEGWAALRQCALDGQHILECGADTSVPNPPGGEEEQMKAELKQYVSLAMWTLTSIPTNNLQGTPGRVLETARRTKDLSPTGSGTTMGRIQKPGAAGRRTQL